MYMLCMYVWVMDVCVINKEFRDYRINIELQESVTLNNWFLMQCKKHLYLVKHESNLDFVMSNLLYFNDMVKPYVLGWLCTFNVIFCWSHMVYFLVLHHLQKTARNDPWFKIQNKMTRKTSIVSVIVTILFIIYYHTL